jgi:hypothetical protein
MKSKIASIQPIIETRQGDGRLSVTLLGLIMAAAAAIVFQLTFTYIDPQDTLSRQVPADAAFYLHINADRMDDAAANMLLPQNVRADEVAKFAVVNNDGGLVWGTLFAWRHGHQPTADEQRLLNDGDALRLDANTYLSTDSGSVRQLYTAERAWPSLADENSTMRSLAAVRGLMPIQGYLNPIIVPPQTLAGAASFLKELEPMVFALDKQEDGYFSVVMPTRIATAIPLLIGFGANRRDARDQGLTDALASTIRLSADRAVFDPLAVFFGKIEKARAEFGLESDEQANKAADDLRRLLATSSVNLSTFIDDASKQAYIGAEFPDIAEENMISGVTAYLGASLPERTTLALPDGDMVTEIRLDPENYAPKKATDGSDYLLLDIPSVAGFKLIFAENGRGGVIIANDEMMIERYRGEWVPETRFPGRCGSLSGRKIGIRGPLINNMITLFGLSKTPSVTNITEVKFGLFIENSDDILISCGYR